MVLKRYEAGFVLKYEVYAANWFSLTQFGKTMSYKL